MLQSFNFYRTISDKFGTPFYLFYPEKFRNNIRSFKKAFAQCSVDLLMSYSFKTNYLKDILLIAKDEGLYAEVVSDMEYELALKLGYKPNEIILNGPIKTYDLLKKAILLGSLVQLDSLYEVSQVIQIKKENPTVKIQVGIRINMTINTDNGSSAIQAGYEHSHFGFSDDLLNDIVVQLTQNNIHISSLHGHVSSSNRVPENYAIILQRLLSICRMYSLSVNYLDIGGGFFGAVPDGMNISGKPTYLDYAETVAEILKNSEWFQAHHPKIVIEPGTSVVANVLDVVSKIYQQKRIADKNFVIIDGGLINVKTLLGKANYLFDVISENAEEEPIITDVVGSTCMERDVVLSNVRLTHYSYGDFLHFKAVGAYVLNMTPMFINYIFPVFSVENGDLRLVRKKQTIQNLLDLYV